jgi:hypothetical protein
MRLDTEIADGPVRMTQREGLRAFGCSAGLGAAWGWAAGAAVMLVGGPALAGVLPALVIGLVYGATIGAVVGLALGMPTAVLVARLRHRVPRWRSLGAGVVALGAGLAVGVLALGEWDALAWKDLPVVLAPSAASAISAWFGLGWIFRR